MEKVTTGKELKAKAEKIVRKRKIIIGVDKSYEDVLKLQSEGHDLFFNDTDDDFLELSDEQYSELNPQFKLRYRTAKNIAYGEDVIGTATDGTKGFTTDYNVRAGSAGEQTAVYGKKMGMDYTWVRPDNMGKRQAEGWVVDNDTSTNTRFSKDEAGTQKTVGGQRAPELVLCKRSKQVTQEVKSRRKDIRNGRLKKTQDSARNTLLSAGAKIIE